MDSFNSFLWQMKKGEIFAETFLVKKMTEKGLLEAIEKGFIRKIGETDIGVAQYTITDSGLKNR